VAFSHTEPLRRELASALPKRPFAVRFWDGSTVEATEPDAPTFTIASPVALAHVLRAPGELGLGRAYVEGLIEVDSLDSALLVVDNFEPPPLDLKTKLRLGVALIRATGLVKPPSPPAAELRLRGERHTLARDKAAIAHHYDAGNDFFALFLDESMTYSCARFDSEDRTLEQAQAAKLELICSKLELKPGMRVLEIGCGWGSFAIHAAQNHGARVVGITLSERQAELGRKRVQQAGVGEQVEIRLVDYREIGEENFDAVATIEMIEAVGDERVDLFARCIEKALRPGGTLACQGIAKLSDFDTADEGPFSERFVFPDGVPLPISRVELALERANLAMTHFESFPHEYISTLTHWIEKLESSGPQVVRVVGEQRDRIWRLYLRSARQAFETGWATVYQLVARKGSR
jgi:cyclopropane-fatty-acyl-phospholipid synthase